MKAKQPNWSVQEAIYDVLNGDSELTDQADVYDYLPEDTDYPYVVIGEFTDNPSNAHDRFGREVTATLHVWSDYRGNKEAAKVIKRVIHLLDHQPLDIEEQHHIVTRYEQGETLRDKDEPKLRHHVAEFRVITEQIRS